MKYIPGFEGIYSATKNGRIYSHKSKKYLKPNIVKGREIVHLCVNYKHSFHFIHKLIYITFKGEIPEGLEIDHINENKRDNRLKNLQLLTHQENVQKYFNHNPRERLTNGRFA